MAKTSTSSAHTAGPWYLQESERDYEGQLIRTEEKIIAAVCTTNPDIASSEEECNARLIVSAPELLDVIMDIADASDSPSHTIINMSNNNDLVDFLMDEYNRRTQA